MHTLDNIESNRLFDNGGINLHSVFSPKVVGMTTQVDFISDPLRLQINNKTLYYREIHIITK